MAQPNLIPKRISALPKMIDDEVTAELIDKTKSADWAMAIDSLRRSNSEDRTEGSGLVEGTDEGSFYVPMNRLALRDLNGLIPASMLPTHIDDMIFGTLAVDSTNGKASFTETAPSGSTNIHVYVSPTAKRTTGELEPPENTVFCDTTTNLQYRYIKAQENTINDTVKYGFTEVPGSRALTTTYGIEITPDQNNASVTINAKKADYYTSYGASTAETVNSTASNIPLASDSSESSVLAAEVGSNRLTKITGLTGGARYAVNLQLECTPVALSANVIDVSVTCGTVPAMKQQMDMSGPTGTATVLNYFCEFKNGDNNTELTVTIAAEEAITVKTTRFTVFELL